MAPAAATSSTNSQAIPWGGIVMIAGGALATLGSFLSWASATAALIGTISRNGIDGGGDGIITIIVGLLALLFGVAIVARSGRPVVARVGGLVCAAVLAYICVVDFGDVNQHVSSISSDFATASVGMGLYVVGLGALLIVVGALLRQGSTAT